MHSKLLTGKTILLTGSTVVQSVSQLIEQNGGEVKHFPLIEIVENVSPTDEVMIRNLQSYNWLIFTSQNAVQFFMQKCERYNFKLTNLKAKLVAVGEKTAKQLKAAKLFVHFIPSTYSADVLVKEFQLAKGENALFIRGSLAKSTITDALKADEWTVYETRPCTNHLSALEQCIVTSKEPIVIFASPSAVDVYAKEIVPMLDWHYVKVASIGHITTATLAKYGVIPIVQPKTYTMQAVIEQLLLEENNL